MAGLIHRVGRKGPPVNKVFLAHFRSFVKNWLAENLTPLDADCDVSVETWLKNANYPESRKKQIRVLHDRESKVGYYDNYEKLSHVKSFIKKETYPTYKNPRGIYARGDEFKLRVGPIFKLIEQKLFSLKFFIKKIPVVDRPRYISERFANIDACVDDDNGDQWRITNGDYTAYESAFIYDVFMACEYQLYEYMVQLLPAGDLFLERIRNVIMKHNKISFSKRGKGTILRAILECRRMSGEMNTSLGNGFTDLMITKFFISWIGGTYEDCLVEGDDCLATYYGKKIPIEYYAYLGFTIKLVYLRFPNLASFCGQIFDFESLTVIADPIKIILNFGWASDVYRNASIKLRIGLIRAKALSLLFQYPGCPILQSMALSYIRLTNGFIPVVDVTMNSYEQSIKYPTSSDLPSRSVSHTSRLLMAEVYNFTIADQISLEYYFDNMMRLEPIYHPIVETKIEPVWREFNRLYVLDGGEPYSRVIITPH